MATQIEFVPGQRETEAVTAHVLWMTIGLSCEGDSVAMTSATNPSLEDIIQGVIPGMPRVVIHNQVIAFEVGDEYIQAWYDAEAGKLDPFVLVIEGSVPNEEINGEGYFTGFGVNPSTGQPITLNEWIDRLAPKAAAVVAVGTCATYGGIPAMKNNPTGAMGVADYLGWKWTSKAGLPVINIPGCPAQPDNMTEVLMYLVFHLAGMAPVPELDEQLRPKWLFGRTVREGCNRAGFVEEGNFATEYGSDHRCMVKLGCKGPVVKCNVPVRGWVNGVGGCPNVGGICMACTMPVLRAGAGRFQPPAKPKPWSNIRAATALGPRSPQLLSSFHGFVPPEVEVMDRDETMGEDCLVLNVWTPALDRGRKLPVMVWLHGGGYTSGSGRLHLLRRHRARQEARGGGRNGESPTVGVWLSLPGRIRVRALRRQQQRRQPGHRRGARMGPGQHCRFRRGSWQRHDFRPVGWRAAKSARSWRCPRPSGLFKRAIVQSGAAVKGISRDAASQNAEQFLARLNLRPSQLDKLQEIPLQQLLMATDTEQRPAHQLRPGGRRPLVADGSFRSGRAGPVRERALAHRDGRDRSDVFPGSAAGSDRRRHVARARETVAERARSDADVDRVIAAYRAGRPGAPNTDLFLIMASDGFRAGILLEAERKAAQGQAPVYQYYFTWRSPVREGKLRSFTPWKFLSCSTMSMPRSP